MAIPAADVPFEWQAELSATSAFSSSVQFHNYSTPAITKVSFADKDFSKQTEPSTNEGYFCVGFELLSNDN